MSIVLRTNAPTSTWRKCVVANTQLLSSNYLYYYYHHHFYCFPLSITTRVSYTRPSTTTTVSSSPYSFFEFDTSVELTILGRGPLIDTQVICNALVIMIMIIRTMSSSTMISYVGSITVAVISMRRSMMKKMVEI